MQKLIIFDVDGTLIDSQHQIVEAMTSAFVANNMQVPHRSLLIRSIGLSLTEAMSTLAVNADRDTVAKLVASYRIASHESRRRLSHPDPLFPGARETIERLAARDDVVLGIATGKGRRGTYLFLERENLRRHIATVQTADDAPSKPHPGMIRQAMVATGTRPENTTMIGDTKFDVSMARAAGARAIGVSWGYHAPEDLAKAGASAVVSDFAGLMVMLSQQQISAVA